MNRQKITDVTIFLLRVVAAYIFIQNGGWKLFGWFGIMPEGTDIGTLMLIAGIVEVVGGFMILIGLWTRIAAFISSGQMAVAYFIAHANQGYWHVPLMNEGQPSVLLCFVFLFFAAYGAGIWSIDALLKKRRHS